MISAFRAYISDAWGEWNEFWYTPVNPATYSAIRVLAGAMLLYTHLIWILDLSRFFGQRGWLPTALMKEFYDFVDAAPGQSSPPHWNWSYFNYIDSSTVLWAVHIAALLIFFFLMIGLFSRVVAVLAFLAAVSY